MTDAPERAFEDFEEALRKLNGHMAPRTQNNAYLMDRTNAVVVGARLVSVAVRRIESASRDARSVAIANLIATIMLTSIIAGAAVVQTYCAIHSGYGKPAASVNTESPQHPRK